jgi:hypothetical protein
MLTEVGEIDTDIVGGGGVVMFPPLPHPKRVPTRNSANHSFNFDFPIQPSRSRPTVLLVHTSPLGVQNLLSILRHKKTKQ